MNDGAPLRPAFVVGAFPGMPFATYRSIEAMSFGGSGHILKSPQHYILNRTQPKPSTEDQIFGQCVHSLVLELDKFPDHWAVAPKCDRRTTAGKALWAEHVAKAGGRSVIPVEDYARALRCAEKIRRKRAAARLLDGAQTELSIFWIDGEYGVPCKARLDFRNAVLRGIGDVKTFSTAEAEAVAAQCARMGYHRQQAHYWSGCEHVFDESPEFSAMIFSEDDEPHEAAVYTMPPVALQQGRREMDEALARYAKCLERGSFDAGYDEEIRDLEFPRWRIKDRKR